MLFRCLRAMLAASKHVPSKAYVEGSGTGTTSASFVGLLVEVTEDV